MDKFFRKYLFPLVLFCVIFILHACKTDEFKFDEMTIKEDWGFKLISPMFSGMDKDGHVLEFRDFIHDWKMPVPNPSAPYTVLQYSDSTYNTIPTRLIFDSSVIIDNYGFYIQGSYRLTEIEIEFIVTNHCPFPLNLQLQFFHESSWNKEGPPILPPAFPEADFSQTPFDPVKTVHNLKLDSLQSQSLTESNRVKITSWFDQTNFINENDTIYAHYPIEVAIVIVGKVQTK